MYEETERNHPKLETASLMQEIALESHMALHTGA